MLLEWQCKKYSALPEPGGYLDQDAGLMNRMASAGNVFETVARLRSMNGEQIHQLTDSERRLIRTLLEDGFI